MMARCRFWPRGAPHPGEARSARARSVFLRLASRQLSAADAWRALADTDADDRDLIVRLIGTTTAVGAKLPSDIYPSDRPS